VVLLRDVGQARVDLFGEGEKLVSLILQRDADRSNAVRGMGLERSQLCNDEVVELATLVSLRPDESQNVLGQPSGEGLHIVEKPHRL